MCEAPAGAPVLEFGLRRAQGVDGALAASRAAYLGGCSATSNVLAGKRYGIPVHGTHAHSWVMSFTRYAGARSSCSSRACTCSRVREREHSTALCRLPTTVERQACAVCNSHDGRARQWRAQIAWSAHCTAHDMLRSLLCAIALISLQTLATSARAAEISNDTGVAREPSYPRLELRALGEVGGFDLYPASEHSIAVSAFQYGATAEIVARVWTVFGVGVGFGVSDVRAEVTAPILRERNGLFLQAPLFFEVTPALPAGRFALGVEGAFGQLRIREGAYYDEWDEPRDYSGDCLFLGLRVGFDSRISDELYLFTGLRVRLGFANDEYLSAATVALGVSWSPPL